MLAKDIDKNTINKALLETCSEASLDWFNEQLDSLRKNPDSTDDLDIALAMARRKMGDESLGSLIPELTLWYRCDAARVLLLVEAMEELNHAPQDLLKRAYKVGDELEKEAILKGISLLDPEGQLKELVVDACRTNIVPMLGAVAMYNTYPSRFFDELEFNQMVLKCLFLGLDVSHVSGLTGRSNVSLSRMCFDYMRERLAADREPPSSIWLAINASDIEDSVEFLEKCLQRDNPVLHDYMFQSLKNYCSGVVKFDEFSQKYSS